MEFTREQTLHLARLARLELSEDEVERYHEELARILEYVARLEELDLEGVEPTTHAGAADQQLRDDVPGEVLDREELLEGAPATHEGMIRVPRVVGDE